MKHNWEYKPIEDCFAYIKNGATIKQEKGAVGFPITRIETLSNGVFNRSKMGYANILELGKYALNVLNDGDLLMSHINSKTYVGRTVLYEALPNEIIIHGMNLLRLIPNETTLSKFFYYITLSHYFKSKIVNIRKDAVNQSSFSITDLKKIHIPVPQMKVQKRIVAELDKVNEVMEDCRELLRNLDALAQSLFYDIFGDPITNPKGWEMKSIQAIAKTTAGGTPSKSHPEYYNNGNILWLRSGEVCKMNITNTELRITVDGMQNSSAKLVPINSVVVAMYGATAAQVGIIRTEMALNQAICAILPNKHTNPIYLYFCLSTLKERLLQVAHGAAQPNISQAIIKTTSIPVPPLTLQEQFAERIEAIEAEKKHVEATIAELQTLLASRMDYWFN